MDAKQKKIATIVGIITGSVFVLIISTLIFMPKIKAFIQLKKEEKFQVILCTSVIEHLKDPGKALRNWRSFLSNEGLLIVSTPNIGHFSARIEILLGNFPSHDYGIFDENHLHFFTLKSFQRLIKKNGFNLEHLGIDPIGGRWPKISRFLSLFFPGLFAYQIIIKAKKASDKLF